MSLYDRANVCKTLLCLLQGIEGQRTTIELRNENSVVGTIDTVDARMNINLSNAEFHTLDGCTMHFEQFFVRGLQIRFVHIPNHVDMLKTIEKRVTQEQKIATKGKFEKRTKKTKKDVYKKKVDAEVEKIKKGLGLHQAK